MTLTDRGLLGEKANLIGGVQRMYDLGNGYKLSAINSERAHSYPYAWEFAVFHGDVICYDTPLTGDVVVTYSDDEANAFIELAFKWAEGLDVYNEGHDNDTIGQANHIQSR